MNLLDLARSALAELTPTDLTRRAATPTEAAELRELVALVAADWPEDQRAEALAAALADPADALTCYRALAGDPPKPPAPLPDDRRPCTDCGNLTSAGRCLAAQRGELSYVASRNYSPFTGVPRRCEGFTDRARFRAGG